MAKNHPNNTSRQKVSAQPRLHQRAAEIQAYGTVNHLLPLDLEDPVRLEMTAQAQPTPGRHHDAARLV